MLAPTASVGVTQGVLRTVRFFGIAVSGFRVGCLLLNGRTDIKAESRQKQSPVGQFSHVNSQVFQGLEFRV